MRRKPHNLLGQPRPCTTQEFARWCIYRDWCELADNLPNNGRHEDLRRRTQQRADRLSVPYGYDSWVQFNTVIKEWLAWSKEDSNV
jgi:hypothetical protein